MAEPVAREENAESVMPSPQDDDEGAVESGADDDEERAPFRMIYNKFLSKYWRWVNGEVAELVGRELLRKRVSFSLWGKSYEQKKLLARAFWNEKGCKQSEQTRILEHWRRAQDGDSKHIFLRSKSACLTYNGECGLLSSIPVAANPQSPEIEELEFVVQQCQKCEYVRAAWESFQVFWTEKAGSMGWSEYAFAFEVCSKTLREDRLVRLHAHASIRSSV